MPVGTHVYWLSHLWHSWLCCKAVLFADNRCHLLHHIIINTPCRGKDLRKSPPFTLSTSISRIMSAKVFAGVFYSESACLLTSSCHFVWLKRLACYCWVVFHHECLAAMTLVQEMCVFFFICLPGSRLSENSFVWLKKKKKKNNSQIWTTTHADAKSFFPFPLHDIVTWSLFLLQSSSLSMGTKVINQNLDQFPRFIYLHVRCDICCQRLQKASAASSTHGNVPVNLNVRLRPHLREPDLPCTCSCQQEKRCASCLPHGSFIHSERHVYELYRSQSAHLSACAANKIASSTL